MKVSELIAFLEILPAQDEEVLFEFSDLVVGFTGSYRFNHSIGYFLEVE